MLKGFDTPNDFGECVTEVIVLLGVDVVSMLCVRYNRCS